MGNDKILIRFAIQTFQALKIMIMAQNFALSVGSLESVCHIAMYGIQIRNYL